MAKKKIQVMVDSDVYDTLVDFAGVTRQSLSSTVSDYLSMALPTFQRMADTLRGFSDLTEKQKQAFALDLQEAECLAKDQVQEALLLLNSTLLNHDHRQMHLREFSATKTAQVHPAGTPATNRGDRTPSKKPSKPNPSKASKPIPASKKIKKLEA